jgi:hypothetical protein
MGFDEVMNLLGILGSIILWALAIYALLTWWGKDLQSPDELYEQVQREKEQEEKNKKKHRFTA